MAIYHCSVKVLGRSQGRSAIASASYRSGEVLHSDETDRTFDYTRKEGIAHSEITLCENAPHEYANRGVLWNAVQAVEKTKDAQLAREVEFALPNELPLEEQINICREVAEEFASQGMIADWSIHHPDKAQKNDHCHMMLTMRGIDENGKWMPKERKEYALDDNGQRIPVLDENGKQKIGAKGRKMWQRRTVETNNWNDQANVPIWRKMVEDKINKGLERNGFRERVDSRSLKDQGINREPTIHEGVTARKMERRGEVSERCQINREIHSNQAKVEKINKQIETLKSERIRTQNAMYEDAKNDYLLVKPMYKKSLKIKKEIEEHDDWMWDIEQDMKKVGMFKSVPKELRETYQTAQAVNKMLEKDKKALFKEISERFGIKIETFKDVKKLYDSAKNRLDKIAHKLAKPDSDRLDNPYKKPEPITYNSYDYYKEQEVKEEPRQVSHAERMVEVEREYQNQRVNKPEPPKRGKSIVKTTAPTAQKPSEKGEFVQKSKNMDIYFKDGKYHLYSVDKLKKSGTLEECKHEAFLIDRKKRS